MRSHVVPRPLSPLTPVRSGSPWASKRRGRGRGRGSPLPVGGSAPSAAAITVTTLARLVVAEEVQKPSVVAFVLARRKRPQQGCGTAERLNKRKRRVRCVKRAWGCCVFTECCCSARQSTSGRWVWVCGAETPWQCWCHCRGYTRGRTRYVNWPWLNKTLLCSVCSLNMLHMLHVASWAEREAVRKHV